MALAVALLAAASGPEAAAEGGTPERGQQVYEQLCAACHGRYGRGEGLVADQLSRRPPDFTRTDRLAGRTDAQVVDALLAQPEEGRPHTPMVMAEVLKRPVLEDAVAYMRTLSVPGEPVSIAAGRDVYGTFCWICHGREGTGQGPAAANLPGPPPRDFTSDDFRVEGREDEIRRTIAQGAESSFHGSEYMLEWGTKLSPQQIDDVIAYLKTFQQPRPAQP